MRWIARILLLASTVCAQEGQYYRDIPIGMVPKEIEIPTAYWFAGDLSHTDAVVVGEVLEVTSEVKQSASQVLPEEACTIRIDSMFGTMPELAGATTVKLHASYVHDTYLQLEPDWGVYRFLNRGQRVMALIHRYEGGPAIGGDVLIQLTEKTRSLPEILKRTQFDPVNFTDADLAVLRAASPPMYEDMVVRVHYLREAGEEERKNSMVSAYEWLAIAGTVLILLAVAGCILKKRKRCPVGQGGMQ